MKLRSYKSPWSRHISHKLSGIKHVLWLWLKQTQNSNMDHGKKCELNHDLEQTNIIYIFIEIQYWIHLKNTLWNINITYSKYLVNTSFLLLK